MLIGLNGATTKGNADLLTDIKISGELGYDFIEIWKSKLYDYLKLKNIAELRNLLVKNNIKAYAINSIENIPQDKIFIFHINDCEGLPIEKLQDEHRLLPGEGVILLKEIARALKSIGYNRAVSIELFENTSIFQS